METNCFNIRIFKQSMRRLNMHLERFFSPFGVGEGSVRLRVCFSSSYAIMNYLIFLWFFFFVGDDFYSYSWIQVGYFETFVLCTKNCKFGKYNATILCKICSFLAIVFGWMVYKDSNFSPKIVKWHFHDRVIHRETRKRSKCTWVHFLCHVSISVQSNKSGFD
jgi:hypothetical protein